MSQFYNVKKVYFFISQLNMEKKFAVKEIFFNTLTKLKHFIIYETFSKNFSDQYNLIVNRPILQCTYTIFCIIFNSIKNETVYHK